MRLVATLARLLKAAQACRERPLYWVALYYNDFSQTCKVTFMQERDALIREYTGRR